MPSQGTARSSRDSEGSHVDKRKVHAGIKDPLPVVGADVDQFADAVPGQIAQAHGLGVAASRRCTIRRITNNVPERTLPHPMRAGATRAPDTYTSA